ncbi:hypothetical protein ACFQ6N_06725 [Kitasatospora sp. NPDC056446]|uniref:hypothetical protein n=1 Tax=Kitasatospora sp. NPDC056446 TaxID=3345819 RepID=UPI00368786F0
MADGQVVQRGVRQYLVDAQHQAAVMDAALWRSRVVRASPVSDMAARAWLTRAGLGTAGLVCRVC